MSPASRTFGLFQRLLARPAPALDDPADLGTCFGLEVSLGQQDEAAPRSAAAQQRNLGGTAPFDPHGSGAA